MSDKRAADLLALTVWKDGELRDPSDAYASLWDHGLLYGDGMFEGIRVRNGWIYRVELHLARLRRSARILRIDLPFSNDELCEGIDAVMSANGLLDAHVRVLVTRGFGFPSLDARNCPTPMVAILAYPFPATLGDEPVRLAVSSVTRKSPRSIDPQVKSLNYLDSILARMQATDGGAHEAVMLDGEGFVAEATGSNIFGVCSDVVFTPECSSALPGITRRTVIELLAESSIPCEVRRVTVGELYAADEVFLTGTGSGIVPVGSIDGRSLPDAPGPITTRITDRLAQTWSDPQFATRLGPAQGED
jgi:branched-chain amino acid aminotransferase